MLGIDVGTGAAIALRLGHDMGSEGGLARGFRAVDLGDPASRQTTDTERKVEGQGAGGHRLDGHRRLVAHLHDGALAELLLDLAERHVQRLVSFHHRFPLLCAARLNRALVALGVWGRTYGGV